jgi:hypothetical protein
MEAYWGSGGIAPRILLTSALDRGEWSASRPDRFIPRERVAGTHWIGGWVGPRAIMDAVVKRKIPSPRRESNPRTPIVQSVLINVHAYKLTCRLWNRSHITLYCIDYFLLHLNRLASGAQNTYKMRKI